MSQKGSIVIFSLVFLVMLLNISIGLLNIFLPKLKIVQEASSSLRAIYAADTAVELCLYEARQKIIIPRIPPILTNGATFTIASLSLSGPVDVTLDCRNLNGEGSLKFGATGNSKGIRRSFEVFQ